MDAIERFEAEFWAFKRPLRRHLEIAEAGVVLGADTVLAPMRPGGEGAALDLSGEDRMLALLRTGFFTPVDARILTKLRRAGEFFAKGEKALAQIHLAQLGLPQISAEQAFRLALADRLIANGFDPGALCKSLGFDLPAGLKKFNPDQPRDGRGRWTSGGAGGEEGRSVSPGGPHGGDESEDDKLEDFKSKFGEDSPQEDVRHGRPIDPLGPTPVPFGGTRPVTAPGALPSKTEFLGKNQKGAGSRWNTDLPGGRAEAEALFERLTAGQEITKKVDLYGNIRLYTKDRLIQLRVKANGEARVERPVDIDGKKRETIHFNGR